LVERKTQLAKIIRLPRATAHVLMDTELSKEPESPLLKELNSLLKKHEL